MKVWAVFDGHRCVSVWTTEAAARQARQPGQYVEEAGLMPTIAAVSSPTVPREHRIEVLDAACSRLTATVTAYGVSARSASQTTVGG